MEERAAIAAVVVHEAIRMEGEEELRRTTSALAWSGLAAGLSMGFSLVAEGLLRAHLPDAAWTPLVYRLGYTVGFLIVVLGRQQLFTENTVTVVIPLLIHRTPSCLLQVLRLWAVVLAANLAGVFLFDALIGLSGVFRPEVQTAIIADGTEAMRAGFSTVLLKGVFAGWLIALMVWLLPASESSRPVIIIIIITYLISLGGFSHIIAGSADTFYLVVLDRVTIWEYLGGFMAPALLGNIVGGTALVALLNHAQVVSGRLKQRDGRRR